MKYILLLLLPLIQMACAVSEPCKRFEDNATQATSNNSGTLRDITAESSAQYEYRSCLERHI